MLKGQDNPYYLFSGNNRFIKLRKDYIQGLGGTVNFTIIGSCYNLIDKQELGIGKLQQISFYIRYLENKDQVYRFNIKLIFYIINKVD